MREIFLAGGCFWGTQEYFRGIQGVLDTTVGYANGNTDSTSYEDIKHTNHTEVVHVKYNPTIVGLEFLLDMYYKVIDPLSVNKQGGDTGTQYRTGIYYTDNLDLEVIQRSISKLEQELSQQVAIEVLPLSNYVNAEDYHQDYLQVNPTGYCHIKKIDFEYAKTVTPIPALTELEIEVTQQQGTEPPFINEFYDFEDEGIYLDKVTHEPLFCSKDKFVCSAGWASFSKPIKDDSITEHLDESIPGRARTEVRSEHAHLGHVFDDGPQELGGLRYCINSASLEFIPKDNMDKLGFGHLLYLFD